MEIKYLKDLNKEEVKSLCKRSQDSDLELSLRVQEIIKEVRLNGDAALLSYAKQIENKELKSLLISQEEINELALQISPSVKNAIDQAYSNIWKFHEMQLKTEPKIETSPGVFCWREVRAIEKVGLYIPGGSAILPSTLLMLGIPAKLANCDQIVVCTPANERRSISPEIAYILTRLDIPQIYLSGGAQAIAAMTFGTETIPAVDKICGPGNRYVTEAKIQLQSFVAIDFPAGPSEVLIIADDTAVPAFVAADLLAQAEHGPDSQAILVSPSLALLKAVEVELQKQIIELPRQEIALKALSNSYMLKTDTLTEAINFSNRYAPEHLILCCEALTQISASVINAGSVFLGNYSPESAGDYASGTNHTLPTSGFAKAYSGVSVDTFVKKITFQQIDKAGIKNLGPTIEILAAVEELQAHKNAVSIRLSALENI